jgi:hypothetical protein
MPGDSTDRPSRAAGEMSDWKERDSPEMPVQDDSTVGTGTDAPKRPPDGGIAAFLC